MKSFADILKQFTNSQRVFVLFLLLFFSTLPVVIVQWMKTDDCRTLMQENLKMQNDFAIISQMLREERMKSLTGMGKNFVIRDSFFVPNNLVSEKAKTDVLQKVIEISDSNIK